VSAKNAAGRRSQGRPGFEPESVDRPPPSPLQVGGERAVDLVALCFAAPLCGIVPGKDALPTLVHAVTMESILGVMAQQEMVSACHQVIGVKLLSVLLDLDEPVPWPISTRNLPEFFKRCAACWYATGHKRPRARFVATSSSLVVAAGGSEAPS
jgi:hypothetical protein